MNKFKTKIPVWTIISAIVTLVLSVVLALFMLIILVTSSVKPMLTSNVVEGAVYLIFFAIFMFGAAIAVFFRKYKLPGTTIIVFGIILLFTFWFFGIILIPCGIIIIRTKENISEKIIKYLSTKNSATLTELSSQIGHNEADIEIAVNELIVKNKKISFDKNSRIVTRI